MLQCTPLLKIWEGIPEYRKARGKRHSIAAMLSLICFGLLCGCRNAGAIAHWGRVLKPSQLRQLGFTHPLSPCATTLQTLLLNLNLTDLASRFSQWVVEALDVTAIAIDGKTLRGSRKQGMETSHILSAVTHGLGCILAQIEVPDKTNEIGACPDLLKRLALQGQVVTVDALLTQVEIARKIVKAEAHYVMLAKGNQESLREDLKTFVELETKYGNSLDHVYDCDKSHGRITERSLSLVVIPPPLRDWPGAQQAFVLKRQGLRQGKLTQETLYGVSSLPREEADAARVFGLLRQHWTIENRQHWVRDVTFDEDRSQVRLPAVAHAMAWFRSAAISILRWAGFKNIAAAFRFFQAQPAQALRLIKSGSLTFG